LFLAAIFFLPESPAHGLSHKVMMIQSVVFLGFLDLGNPDLRSRIPDLGSRISELGSRIPDLGSQFTAPRFNNKKEERKKIVMSYLFCSHKFLKNCNIFLNRFRKKN
jgi:hypothetical protein